MKKTGQILWRYFGRTRPLLASPVTHQHAIASISVDPAVAEENCSFTSGFRRVKTLHTLEITTNDDKRTRYVAPQFDNAQRQHKGLPLRSRTKEEAKRHATERETGITQRLDRSGRTGGGSDPPYPRARPSTRPGYLAGKAAARSVTCTQPYTSLGPLKQSRVTNESEDN